MEKTTRENSVYGMGKKTRRLKDHNKQEAERKWYQFLKFTKENTATFNQIFPVFPYSNVPFGWDAC